MHAVKALEALDVRNALAAGHGKPEGTFQHTRRFRPYACLCESSRPGGKFVVPAICDPRCGNCHHLLSGDKRSCRCRQCLTRQPLAIHSLVRYPAPAMTSAKLESRSPPAGPRRLILTPKGKQRTSSISCRLVCQGQRPFSHFPARSVFRAQMRSATRPERGSHRCLQSAPLPGEMEKDAVTSEKATAA